MTSRPDDSHRENADDQVEQELDLARSSGEDDPTNLPTPPTDLNADPGEIQAYENVLRNLKGARDQERPHAS